MESLTLQPIARVDGTINLPGSKSVSNRALLLAALAHGKTVLTNLLDSDDVRHMLNALTALGVSYTLSADRTRCEIIGNGGPLHAESARELFLGNAGTAMRPLAAALCLGSNWSSGGCAAPGRGEDHLPGTRKLSAIAFTGRLYWRQR